MLNPLSFSITVQQSLKIRVAIEIKGNRIRKMYDFKSIEESARNKWKEKQEKSRRREQKEIDAIKKFTETLPDRENERDTLDESLDEGRQ